MPRGARRRRVPAGVGAARAGQDRGRCRRRCAVRSPTTAACSSTSGQPSSAHRLGDPRAALAAHPELSAVVLRAKAKICTNDVVFCHAEFCEFARDYPAKVQALRPREALLAQGLVLPDAVRAEALRTRACPFEECRSISRSGPTWW